MRRKSTVPLGVFLAVHALTLAGCSPTTVPSEPEAKPAEKTSESEATLIARSTELDGYEADIAAVRWSSDGRLVTVAIFGEQDKRTGAEVCEWRLVDNSRTSSRKFTVQNLSAVALSNDAHQFALASWEIGKNKLDVIDVESGETVETYSPSFTPTALAFSPDRQFLSMGWSEIALQSLGKRDSVGTTRKHHYPISSLSYSADGKRVASGSGSFMIDCSSGEVETPRGAVMVHDAADGHRIIQLADHERPPFALGVHAVCLSPDGNILATANSGIIRLWNVDTGKLLSRLHPPKHENSAYQEDIYNVRAIAFSPDGKQLSVGVGKEVDVWDLASEKVTARLRWHRASVTTLAYSHDGRYLASAGGSVKIWDMRPTPPPLQISIRPKHVLRGHTYWASSATYSPDGKTLVSGDSHDVLKFWNPLSGELLSSHEQLTHEKTGVDEDGKARTAGGLAYTPAGGEIKDVAYTPDGKFILVVGGVQSGPGVIREWDVAEGKVSRSFGSHKNQIARVLVTPDGKTVITASYRQVKFWDYEKGKSKGKIAVIDGVYPYGMALSPDGTTLVTGAPFLQFWDVATQKLLWSTKDLYSNSLQFSPDGNTLAVGRSRSVELWNVSKKCLIESFDCSYEAHSLAFSPDGRLLAAGEQGMGRIRIWNTVVRRPIVAPWTNEVALIDAHQNQHVMSLEFSPDGKVLASAGADHMVKLWEVRIDEKEEQE